MSITSNLATEQANLEELQRSKRQIEAEVQPKPEMPAYGSIAQHAANVQAWEVRESQRQRKLEIVDQQIAQCQAKLKDLGVQHQRAIAKVQPLVTDLMNDLAQFNRLSLELRQLALQLQEKQVRHSPAFSDAFGSNALIFQGWKPHHLPVMSANSDDGAQGFTVRIPTYSPEITDIPEYKQILETTPLGEETAA